MKIGLSTAWFAEGVGLEAASRRTRDLGFELLAFASPGPVAFGSREAVRAAGLSVCSVLSEGEAGASDPDFPGSWEPAARQASRLKATHVVVEGGPVGGRRVVRTLREDESGLKEAHRRGESPDVSDAVGHRLEARVEAAERAVRALHAAVRQGIPVAVRTGGDATDLLGFEETGWILGELPELMLYLDAARALRLCRLGLGPPPDAWVEAYGRRSAALVVHGLGSDLAGGSHPEDLAPEWGTLVEALPRTVPGVFDLTPSLAAADVEDALRFFTSSLPR